MLSKTVYYYLSLLSTCLVLSSIAEHRSHVQCNEHSKTMAPVYIGIVAKKVREQNDLMGKLGLMLQSVLHHARLKCLHFVIVCEKEDAGVLDVMVGKLVGKFAQVPVEVDYIDVNVVTDKLRDVIKIMKKHFQTDDPQDTRYSDDLFYIGGAYHRLFPFKRLIMLDADLRFLDDVATLDEEFDHFSPTNLIAIANDLAPHYYLAFSKFRATHPGSKVGLPHLQGGQQGYNSGVVLYNLERMRSSALYNQQLTASALTSLNAAYQFKGSLGDQDFLTLVGMAYPHWFRLLNCTWNRQLDTHAKITFHENFDVFHDCPGQIHVYHGNGGSEIPEELLTSSYLD